MYEMVDWVKKKAMPVQWDIFKSTVLWRHPRSELIQWKCMNKLKEGVIKKRRRGVIIKRGEQRKREEERKGKRKKRGVIFEFNVYFFLWGTPLNLKYKATFSPLQLIWWQSRGSEDNMIMNFAWEKSTTERQFTPWPENIALCYSAQNTWAAYLHHFCVSLFPVQVLPPCLHSLSNSWPTEFI